MCDIVKKPCVLFIDDNIETRELIAVAFERAGFCVSLARTGGDAIQLINDKCEEGENVCFDLIIMDIDLPDVRGTTLATWIRGRYPNILIEFLTAYPAPQFTEIARSIGATIKEKPIFSLNVYTERMRERIVLSVRPNERRRRGAKNESGEYRRQTDTPLVVSRDLAEHIEAVAVARKGAN